MRAIFAVMAAISATGLRQNLYNILDSVVDTGVPVEVERRGRLLRIVAAEPGSKWDRLTAHQVVVGDPDELVHVDWSDELDGSPLLTKDDTIHTHHPEAVW